MERVNFLLTQICNSLRGLYLVNELATMAEVFKEIPQQQAVLVLSFLKTFDMCFQIVDSASSGLFQTLCSRLMSCQLVTLSKRQVRV